MLDVGHESIATRYVVWFMLLVVITTDCYGSYAQNESPLKEYAKTRTPRPRHFETVATAVASKPHSHHTCTLLVSTYLEALALLMGFVSVLREFCEQRIEDDIATVPDCWSILRGRIVSVYRS